MTPTESEIDELQRLRKDHNDLKVEHEKLKKEKSSSGMNSASGNNNMDSNPQQSDFNTRWTDIDNRIEQAIIRRLNDVKQYSMRKNLLLHKAKNIPKDKHGYEFNEWCVDLINSTFLNEDGSLALRRLLVAEDIDRAHILRTKRRDANVVLVQFMNMTVRNEVFFAKSVLKKQKDSYSISEHLTPENIRLLNAAKESAGNAWSSDCKIFVEKGGRKQIIRSPADLGSGNVTNDRNVDGKGRRYQGNRRYENTADYQGQYPYPPPNGSQMPYYQPNVQSPAFIDFRNRSNYSSDGYAQNNGQWY